MENLYLNIGWRFGESFNRCATTFFKCISIFNDFKWHQLNFKTVIYMPRHSWTADYLRNQSKLYPYNLICLNLYILWINQLFLPQKIICQIASIRRFYGIPNVSFQDSININYLPNIILLFFICIRRSSLKLMRKFYLQS